MRLVYFTTGWLFFLLGVIGAVLPVIPTTPFMLLALWAFSKSSDRFHSWLYHHKFFGPPLQQWCQYRVIPIYAKVLSVSMMAVSFLYLLLFRQMHISITLVVALLMLYGVWFVLSKPSSVKAGDTVHRASTDSNKPAC